MFATETLTRAIPAPILGTLTMNGRAPLERTTLLAYRSGALDERNLSRIVGAHDRLVRAAYAELEDGGIYRILDADTGESIGIFAPA